MANDMLEIARQEAERLKLALSKNEDFQKLQHVQRVIDTYEMFESKKTSGLPSTPSQSTTAAKTLGEFFRSARVKSTKVAQVDAVVADHLLKTGVRASSGDLLPIIQAAGIEMSGQVPAKTLSSFLTTSSRFNNLKGFGYGLAEWGDDPGPGANQHQQKGRNFEDLLGSEIGSGAGDGRS